MFVLLLHYSRGCVVNLLGSRADARAGLPPYTAAGHTQGFASHWRLTGQCASGYIIHEVFSLLFYYYGYCLRTGVGLAAGLPSLGNSLVLDKVYAKGL